MQNTSRIQQNPDTLISNFFVAGLSQEQIQEKFDPKNEKGMQFLFDINPEVLFSLYEDPEQVSGYLQQVFPEKIEIYQQLELVNPKFFTFMTTDANGYNSYFHCLTYYERFTKELINHDFDMQQAFEKELKKRERTREIERMKQRSRPTSTQLQEGRHDSFGYDELEENLKERSNVQQQLMKRPIMNFGQTQQAEKTDDTKLMRMFEKLEADSQSNAPYKRLGTTANDKHNLLPPLPLMKKANSDSAGSPGGNNYSTDMPLPKPSLGGLTSVAELPAEQDIEVITLNGEANNPINVGPDHFEEMNPVGQGDSFYSKGGLTPKRALLTQGHRSSQIQDNFSDQALLLQNPAQTANTAPLVIKQNEEYYYAPIAFVIKTEIEHHDIFKDVLVLLFESIRNPDKVVDDKEQNERLAFADFLAHIAFLATMPCPDFNTRFNIEFLGKTLIIEERPFHSVPDKNKIALTVLFEILDVKTIIYCWKALLFDTSLILISSSYSLQFYVAEALKQLLFPLTWQHNYIQPANERLLDYAESPVPIIFCVSPLVRDFDWFDELIQTSGFGNMAVCDIDGSFTNDIKFPQIEEEKTFIRSIMGLKNHQISQFDNAFPDQNKDQEATDKETFIEDIRQLFMYMLQPFLIDLEDCIDQKFDGDTWGTVFANYFLIDKYLKRYEGTQNEQFAKELSQTASFQHFCDDKFNNELTNYQMFLKIVSRDAAFDQTTKEEEEKKYTELIQQFQDDEDDDIRQSHKRLDSQITVKSDINDTTDELEEEEQVVVEWRIPQDNQRVMLFEKLEYIVSLKECMTKQLLSDMNDKLDIFDEPRAMRVADAHDKELQKFYSIIGDLKTLYMHKLEEYDKQLKIAQKDKVVGKLQIQRKADIAVEEVNNNLLSPIVTATTENTFKRMKTVSAAVKGKTEEDKFETSPIRKTPNNPFKDENDPIMLAAKQARPQFNSHISIEQLSQNSDAIESKENTASQETVIVRNTETEFLRVNEESRSASHSEMVIKYTEEKSKSSIMSYKFSDDLEPGEESKKNTFDGIVQVFDNRSGKQSSSESKEFEKNLHKVTSQPHKDSNTTSGFRSDSTFKEDSSSLLVFRDHAEAHQVSPRRKLTTLSQMVQQQYGDAKDAKSQIIIDPKSKGQFNLESNDYIAGLRHSAGLDLVNSKHRITALTYGTSGLLNFVDTLFTQLAARKQVHKQFNYYFALKKQLQELEETLTDVIKQSVLASTSQLTSNLDPNELPKHEMALKISATGYNLANSSLVPTTLTQRRYSAEQIREKLQVNQSINCKNLVVQEGCVQNFKDQDIQHKNRHRWVLPTGWKEKPKAVRMSCQYIMLKLKLFSQFEDQVENLNVQLDEFMSFPQKQRDIFPRSRFLELLKHLTRPQKRRYITNQLAIGESHFQLLIMYDDHVKEMRAAVEDYENYSLNHQLFSSIDICEVVEARRLIEDLNEESKCSELSPQIHSTQVSQRSIRRSAMRTVRTGNKRSTSGGSSCCSAGSPSVKTRKEIEQGIRNEKKKELLRNAQRAKTKIDQDRKEPNWLSNIFKTTKKIDRKGQIERQENTVKLKQSSTTLTVSQVSDDSKRLIEPSSSSRSLRPGAHSLLETGLLNDTENTFGFPSLDSTAPIGSVPLTVDLRGLKSSELQLNVEKFTQEQSFANQFGTQFKLITDPYKKAKKLLEAMIELYRKNFSLIDTKSNKFQAKDVERIQNDLYAIIQKEKKFACAQLFFDQVSDEEEHRKQQQVVKQCFWLNILNYMNLRKLCEIQLCEPRLLRKLENYTMWECFKVTNKIVIQGESISSYDIFHTMLGQGDIDQTTGGWCLKTRPKPLEKIPECLRELAVTEPHQFIYFGTFYPVRKMPRLEVFTKEKFDSQLSKVMQINTEQNIQVQPFNFLVRLPKVLFWIKKIDNKKSDFESILRHLLRHQIIAKDSKQFKEIEEVLNQIACEKQHPMGSRQCQHLVEYDSLHWRFELNQMEVNLNIVTREIKKQERATAVMTQANDSDEQTFGQRSPNSQLDRNNTSETPVFPLGKGSPSNLQEELNMGQEMDNLLLDRGADTITLMNNF